MKLKTLGLATMLACCATSLPMAQAQPPAAQADHAHGGETVAFKLTNWKTMHFEDSKKANQHAEMIKKLGCELKQEKHAGHIDVSYRCAEWRTMEATSHKLADQWISWLKSSGFDVSHGHVDPSFTQGDEVVEFRMVNWKTIHGKGGEQDKQVIDTLSKIGCEVSVAQHLGHSDIKYRAPVWRDVHFADHAQADQLSVWLKQNGFEVAPHKH